MKNKISKILLSTVLLTTSVFASSSYNLEEGWNLIGTGLNDGEISLENITFDDSVKLFWIYDNATGWKAYSKEEAYRELITPDMSMNSIKAGTGIWVLADGATQLNLEQNTATNQTNLFTGTININTDDGVTGLNDVNISLSNETENYSTLTDENGTYTFVNIPYGDYNLSIIKDGYNSTNAQVVLDMSEISYQQLTLQNSSDDSNTYNYTLNGNIKDAISGDNVENVNISIYQGIINSNSGEAYQEVTTLEDGSYSLESLPSGSYTVICSKDGYINSVNNIQLISSEDNATITHDFTIAPYSQNMRIVLSWGETPSDLDSHLVKMDTNSSRLWHVYYSDRTPDGVEANLDVDDTDSYGPETTTLSSIDNNATYKYYVHDYSNKYSDENDALSNSGAKVTVYIENNQYDFYVPSYSGTIWKVFEINNGNITPCIGSECISYESSSTGDNFGLLRVIKNSDIDFKNLPSK